MISCYSYISISGVLGSETVFFVSQDDKARIPIGMTAATLQAPIMMRWEHDYRVRLPDHDFGVSQRHKLIPSVYAGCVISDTRVGYSGPTYIVVRSGKHDSSTAQTHCTDFSRLVEAEEFTDFARTSDGKVKPVLMITVDGGPDECPRFPKVIAAACHTFKTFDLDAMFIASHAPGQSAYNTVERRMAPLSRSLAGTNKLFNCTPPRKTLIN